MFLQSNLSVMHRGSAHTQAVAGSSRERKSVQVYCQRSAILPRSVARFAWLTCQASPLQMATASTSLATSAQVSTLPSPRLDAVCS